MHIPLNSQVHPSVRNSLCLSTGPVGDTPNIFFQLFYLLIESIWWGHQFLLPWGVFDVFDAAARDGPGFGTSGTGADSGSSTSW